MLTFALVDIHQSSRRIHISCVDRTYLLYARPARVARHIILRLFFLRRQCKLLLSTLATRLPDLPRLARTHMHFVHAVITSVILLTLAVRTGRRRRLAAHIPIVIAHIAGVSADIAPAPPARAPLRVLVVRIRTPIDAVPVNVKSPGVIRGTTVFIRSFPRVPLIVPLPPAFITVTGLANTPFVCTAFPVRIAVAQPSTGFRLALGTTAATNSEPNY